MATKKLPDQPKIKKPPKKVEIKKPVDPEEPLNVPEDDPDIILEDDPFENPPEYESPSPGEGP